MTNNVLQNITTMHNFIISGMIYYESEEKRIKYATGHSYENNLIYAKYTFHVDYIINSRHQQDQKWKRIEMKYKNGISVDVLRRYKHTIIYIIDT